MSESEFDFSRQILQIGLMRNQAQSVANRRLADKAIDASQHNYRVAEEAKALLAAANGRIAELEDKLAVKTAAHAGATAQVLAFAKQHPDSPVMADSGKRYRNNDIKRRITLIYEAAFDATLVGLGISNPANRRSS